LTDDVDWATEASSAAAPWYGAHQGKERVADFFQEYGTAVETQEFIPQSFAANETDVFTIVRLTAAVRAAGKQVSMDLHHYFRFRDGKVSYYRGTEDTAQTERAFAG
jgi:ketosteroid isomerase-like protein